MKCIEIGWLNFSIYFSAYFPSLSLSQLRVVGIHVLSFPYLSRLSACNSLRTYGCIFMKFRIGEFYKRLLTDLNFGCWFSFIYIYVYIYIYIYIYIYTHIISFIFIPWIRTGLQNPHGYGNSQIFLKKWSQYKSVQSF